MRVRIERASCLSPCGVEGGQGMSLDGSSMVLSPEGAIGGIAADGVHRFACY